MEQATRTLVVALSGTVAGGFHLHRGPVPDGIGFVLVADGRGCKTGGLGWLFRG